MTSDGTTVISDPAELLPNVREARAGLSSLQAALEHPDLSLWGHAAPQLQHAASILIAVERKLAYADAIPLAIRAELRNEVQALAHDIRRIDSLMRAAATFYSGWAQLVCAALGGYTPRGTVIELAAPARVSVRG